MPDDKSKRGEANRSSIALRERIATAVTLKSELADARARINDGLRHIDRQKAIISELERDGHDASAAKSLLEDFLKTQALYEANVQRLSAELEMLGGTGE
jgi:hypothetical protein